MQAKAPRRFSASTMAMAAVAVVVVVVVALVVVKISGNSSPTSGSPASLAPIDTVANPSVVQELTSVPVSVENAVGVPSGLNIPKVDTGQPPLTIDGKPGAMFIGGEFCPLCAAERWGMILAFSHFGTFSNLLETTSSPWDSDPATATFSFKDATYSSPYLAFTPIENESNDSSGLGTRKILTPLTNAQNALWTKYESHFGESDGFPFIDFNNHVFVILPSYNPAVLQGMTQSEIAAQLTDPNSQVTQGIVGTANYLTAAICSMTNQTPSSVCSITAVTQAAKSIGLKT